ncbi:Lipase [Macleaya cordata]|uniref:Lipase n=1 Tax=Macleaya cordata TaxID=56857 RepID=A0A200R002_MACCD|nr:Lipase [Macleaya cordata]
MANTIEKMRNGEEEKEESMKLRYLIVRPEKVGMVELFRFMLRLDGGADGRRAAGIEFMETTATSYRDDDDDDDQEKDLDHDYKVGPTDDDDNHLLGPSDDDHRLVIIVSIIVRKMIGVLGKPMELGGYLVEFLLNLLSLNGGTIFSLFYSLLRAGKVVRPQRNSETYISAIGHLDGRIDLYKLQKPPNSSSTTCNHDDGGNDQNNNFELGNRILMDLCMMASKLAYENSKVVRNIVLHHWKMHFVEFYNCWNDFQKEKSTQVFILTDKPRDANLILISFRGTEPFDADDWSTDFDYSWYEIPKLGKVHMGFLEALGLGNRDQVSSFHNHLQAGGGYNTNNLREKMKQSEDEEELTGEKQFLPEMVEMTAYYAVRSKLKELLNEHKNAKFVVTGHSLGGALAILFPTVLVLHEEKEMMQRLLGVYTFGQPRIGDRKLGRYMEAQLNHPIPKYFRVVYCNDLVPRLPYDDKTFLYKHFGPCLYYNSLYNEQEVEEEPNRNFFGMRYLIPEYLNAIWELIRSLTMGYTHGPEYKEGWFSILTRVIGLAFPGISAHCPTDYVNSVRLGRMSSTTSI